MDKPFWMVCITHMFLEVYLLTQVALIPIYIVDFNLSLLEASLVPTVQSVIGLLMNIPSGIFADRFSTKHLLFTSMAIEGISAILLSQTNSFPMLLLGVAIMRISSPIYHISGLSQISRTASQKQISRSMGFHNAFGSLGSAIGAISLTIFLSTIGWRWTYLFWAIPILTWGCIILKSTQLDTRVERNKNGKNSGLSRISFVFYSGFMIFLAAIAIREVGITGTSTFMTTYLVNTRGLSQATASLIFGLGPIMGILGSLNGGYLGDKIGGKKALSISILGCAISVTLLVFISDVYLLTLVYFLFSFFNNSVWTPMNTIVANLAPATERGIGYSAYFVTEGIIQTITPTIAATIILFSNIWYLFPFNIIFIIISLVVLQFLPYSGKQSIEE